MAKKKEVYRIHGQRVPSVTTILNVLSKPQLIPWASRMAVEYVRDNLEPGRRYSKGEIEAILADAKRAHAVNRDDAADFGSTVHSLIEAHIGGQEVKAEGAYRTIYDNFKRETRNYDWIASEIVVLDEDMEYGGTADGLAVVDGDMTLVDVKTSSGVYPEHSLQLAMYRHAVPEKESLRQPWSQIERCVILHLDKDRLTWETLERDTQQHMPFIPNIVNMYQWQKDFS